MPNMSIDSLEENQRARGVDESREEELIAEIEREKRLIEGGA